MGQIANEFPSKIICGCEFFNLFDFFIRPIGYFLIHLTQYVFSHANSRFSIALALKGVNGFIDDLYLAVQKLLNEVSNYVVGNNKARHHKEHYPQQLKLPF